MRWRGCRVLRIAAATGLAAAAVTLAAPSGGLIVRVLEAESGAPLAGVEITLSNARRLVPSAAATTGADGRAAFPVLPPGEGYAVEAFGPGRARGKVTGLRVRIGETLEVPVRLAPALEETVTVAAVREGVDLADTTSTTRFADAFLQDLPIRGRFYQNALVLAPGVVDADEDGNPNVHGARARDFKALIGGVSNVDPLTGQWLSHVHPESIEEIEVVPAGAGVEMGRAQGGFAQILQKQGSNDLEGVASLIYGSSRLDRSGALPERNVPSFRLVQPSIQISGPIRRDRAWFRLSHQWVDRDDPLDIQGAIVLATHRLSMASDQLTWQVSPANRLVVQHQRDPLVLGNVGVSSRVPASASQRREFGGPFWSLSWTAAPSPRVLAESVVAYQDQEVAVLPTTRGVRNSCLVVRPYPVLNDAQCFYTNLDKVSGSYFRDSRDHRQRLTVKSQAVFHGGRFWGASHRFKVGFIAENERYDRALVHGPEATFFTVRTLNGPVGFASFRLSVPAASRERITGASWGVWAEDQIRLRPNLVLTAGLRLDAEGLDSRGWSPFDPEAESRSFLDRRAQGADPRFLVQQIFTGYEDLRAFQEHMGEILGIEPSSVPLTSTAVQSSFWDRRRRPADLILRNTNLSPRASIAWDPGQDGKTRLAATAGRYYDKIFLAVPLVELEPATTVLTFTAFPFGAGDGRAFAAFQIPSQGATLNARVVDRGLRTPYQDERSLSFEREIAPETSMKLTWLTRDFRDQLQDIDVNHAPADYGRCIPRAPWVDTSAGPDGLLDDCHRGPDGFADLYVRNPGWGDIYVIGNFNEARYRAFVLELVRRQHLGWQMEASYTWSKAIGDAEDYDQLLGNDRTVLAEERGFLAYDQRHVVKVNVAGRTRHGVRFGSTVQWESGLPYSAVRTALISDAIPPGYDFGSTERRVRLRYAGRRNDRRSPSFWTFNARLGKEWNIGARAGLSITAEVFNLLNDDSIRILDETDGRLGTMRRFGRRWQLGMRAAF